jgi:hypothetical protein
MEKTNMNEDKLSMDAAYLRGIVQQAIRDALKSYSKQNNCSMADTLKAINLIAKAEKADLDES